VTQLYKRSSQILERTNSIKKEYKISLDVEKIEDPLSHHLYILTIELSKDQRIILIVNFYESMNKPARK